LNTKYPDLQHSQTILQSMNQHRKEITKLCDVVLKIDDVQIHAHRSVLASCSEYFMAMFTNDMKETYESIVVMKDVKPDVISDLVDFVYTGHLDVNNDNVESTLEHSSLIQLPKAIDICCDFLEKQLDSTNCIGIRKFAALYQCTKDFLIKVDNFMKKHFLAIVESEEFVTLSITELKNLLCDQSLKVDNEEQVYNVVMKWVSHDQEDRGPKLHVLLSQVKLPLLSRECITDVLDKENLIKQNLKCRDLLDEAKNYHLQPENHSKLRNWRTSPRFSTAGLLFAVGGKETGELITDKVECFCLYEKKWKSVASLSCQRQQLCVCELNGNIYAIAGTDGTTRMNSVEMYSFEKNTWTATPSLQVCRSGAGAVSLRDVMYVLSGYDGRVCLTSVERYDDEACRWDYVSPMHIGRSFPGVAGLGGRLFIVGGNDGTAFLNTCEVYDPISDRWSHIAPMNTARAGIGCAVQDGILYAAGGFDGIQRLDTVEIYEPRMNAWSTAPSMTYSRDGVSLASYGGYIHAIGGIDGPSYLTSVEYYDPNSERWLTAFSMQKSRAAAGVAVLSSDKFISIGL